MKKLMTALSLTLLLWGCQKNVDTNFKNENANTAPIEQARKKLVLSNPVNIKVQAGYVDKEGVLRPFPPKRNDDTPVTEADFEGCSERSYLYDMSYSGYGVYYDTYTSEYILDFYWTLGVPHDDITLITSGTFNKGYLRFPNNPYPGSTAWRNVADSYNLTDTYTVNDNGTVVNMDRYVIHYSFSISEDEYCNNLVFHTYFKIATDCSELPFIQYYGTPSYKIDDFEPDTYIVYPYGAINYTATSAPIYDIQFSPLIPTPTPCHQPSLGNSPYHEVRYRKQGDTTWVYKPRTNLSSFVEVVSSGVGTYEYQSRGELLSGPVYTEWTAVQTVNVN